MAFFIGSNKVIDDNTNASVGIITATQTKIITSSEKIVTTSTNAINLVYNSQSGSNVGYALSPTDAVTLNVTGIPTSTDFNDFSLSFKVIINSIGSAKTCSAVTLNNVNRPIYWNGGSLEAALGNIDISDGHAVFKFDAINVTGSATTITNYNVFGSLEDFYPNEGIQKTYMIMSDSTSVNEGATITYTIMTTNVPSGTPLYWNTSTSSGTVKESDFTDGAISGSVMVMNGMATLTRTLSSDSQTEGIEGFSIQLRSTSPTGPVVAVSPMVSVNDTSLQTSPEYMLMPAASIIPERGSVNITVNTTNVGSGTTLYWTTQSLLGQVDALDFTDNSLSGSVVINGSGIGTITRTLRDDAIVEQNETFAIQLRTGSTSGTIVDTSAGITIVNDDIANQNPAESPLYAINPVGNIVNVDEGNSVVYNVLTANVGSGTTLYWTTDSVSGTINSSDFTDNATSGSVVINNGCGVITRTLSLDGVTEGAESFVLRLRTGSTSGSVVATSSTVSVRDFVLPSPTYTITPSSSNVNEGNTVTFSVTAAHVPNGTTLYWSTTSISGTVNASDFTDSATTGSVMVMNGSANIPRTLVSDLNSEGIESFQLQLRTGSVSGTVVATSTTVTIDDTSTTPVAAHGLVANAYLFTEGDTVYLTAETTNVPNDTILYWTTTGTVNASDFTDGVTSGTVMIMNGCGTIMRPLSRDGVTEGNETFQIQLRTGSVSGSIVATCPTITVRDYIAPSPTYMIMPNVTSGTEGNTVNLAVNTTNVPSGTMLYWTTHSTEGTVDAADFTDGVTSGEVDIDNGVGSISRTFTRDAITEGTERYEIRLRTGSISGPVVATSPIITIYDFTPPAATYSLIPAESNVNEGGTIEFMAATTNVPNGTTLYWTTQSVSGTVNAGDFTDSATSGTVVISGGIGIISRSLVSDLVSEGIESFRIQLRTGSVSGSVVATSAVVTIDDTSTTPVAQYSLTANATTLPEGAQVTFNVLTTNVPNGTTLYWSTNVVSGNVTAADFVGTSLTGSVVVNGGMATIPRGLVIDRLREPPESFQLQLRTGSVSGTVVATSPTVSVVGTLRRPTHGISPAAVSVNEGSSITFNVTTTNVPNGTSFFWNAIGFSNSASSADFVDGKSFGSVVINGGTGSITLNIKADAMTEGTESFRLQLFSVGANGEAGAMVAQSGTVNILDTSTSPVAPPIHVIVPDKTAIVVREGNTISFVVNVTNYTNATETLYWTTTGTCNAADFNDNVTAGSVTVVNGRGVITRSIKLDFKPERTENFQIQIRSGSTAGPVLATSPTVIVRNTFLLRRFRYFVTSGSWFGRILIGSPLFHRITVRHEIGSLGGRYRIRIIGIPSNFTILIDGQPSMEVFIDNGQTREHTLQFIGRTAGLHIGNIVVEPVGEGEGETTVSASVTVDTPAPPPNSPTPATPPHPFNPPVIPPVSRPPVFPIPVRPVPAPPNIPHPYNPSRPAPVSPGLPGGPVRFPGRR